jgi:UDP-N-acetylmuramoylalanine--D-glutamate ligase
LLKGVDISALVEKHAGTLAAAIVIGKDRSLVLEALAAKAGTVPVVEVLADSGAEVMAEAVAAAARFASSGDVVLLAPAAASMDQFKDYADRGTSFAIAVRTLIGEENG